MHKNYMYPHFSTSVPTSIILYETRAVQQIQEMKNTEEKESELVFKEYLVSAIQKMSNCHSELMKKFPYLKKYEQK